MKVLVTGGRGFLGKALCSYLFTKGHDPISFASSSCNILNCESFNHLLYRTKPDAVIHLAAKVGGIGANKKNPAVFAYQNLQMGINVIDSCHRAGVKKVVIAGTICAYPKFTPVPFKEESIWNGYPEETNAPYGLAKKMLLVLCQSYRQQYGDNFIYLLPVNLYGPGDNFDPESSHVIPAMILKMHEAKVNNSNYVVLWGDGSPTREFLYVKDCAKAFCSALEKYNDPKPVNIGSGKEISMRDLAAVVQNVVGYKGKITWDSSMPNGQPRRCLDVTRAKEKLNWVSDTELDDGLRKTYEWFTQTQRRHENV